jgi:hypothetical protein
MVICSWSFFVLGTTDPFTALAFPFKKTHSFTNSPVTPNGCMACFIKKPSKKRDPIKGTTLFEKPFYRKLSYFTQLGS